jgi:hypothetical protein
MVNDMAIETWRVHRKDRLGFRATRGVVPTIEDGIQCYVNSSLTDGSYQDMFAIYTACLLEPPPGALQDYEAFPNGLADLVQGRQFILYSNRESHVEGSNVIMARVNDPWDFNASSIDQVLFSVSGQPIADADTSLIAPYMVNGNAFLFTRTLIWKENNVVQVSTLPLIEVPGYSPSFNQQSIDRLLPDGTYGRFGYQSNTLVPPYSSTAFFVSDESKQVWTLRAIAASDQSSKRFTEADFVVVPGAQVGLPDPLLIALYREDNAGSRNIAINFSVDNGNTWTTPAFFNSELVSGTQPVSDGISIWSFGDRTGSSGSSPLGYPRQYNNQTGIKLQRMTATTVISGTWVTGKAECVTGTPHNLFPGNPFIIRDVTPDGWNTEMAIAQEGTADTTLVYNIRNNPTAFSGAGYVIGMGWERQIATFVGTDGGQYEFNMLDDGETVCGAFYGQRRQPQGAPSPRITFARVNTRFL